MEFWNADRWGALVSRQGVEQWIPLQRPIALIGTHPSCDIQLHDRRLPPVVYFVVHYERKIEVWPLCAIAYPVWGSLKSGTQILVGRSQIKISTELDEAWPETPINRPGDAINEVELIRKRAPKPDATLVLDWGSGKTKKPLTRRVAVLGEGHPSLIRMHGVGLETCDTGIICLGKRVWLVNLTTGALDEWRSVESPTDKKTSLIQELTENSESVVLGQMHVWLNRVGEKSIVEQVRPSDPSDSGLFAEIESDDEEEVEPQNETAISHPDISATDHSADRLFAGNGPTKSNLAGGHRAESQAVRKQGGRDADAFATHFTDRMLKKSERRAWRGSVPRIVFAVLLALSALVVIGLIVFWGVAPILKKIYFE